MSVVTPFAKQARNYHTHELFCSFCGSSQKDVEWLVRGLVAFICSDCIDCCAESLAEKRKRNPKPQDKSDG